VKLSLTEFTVKLVVIFYLLNTAVHEYGHIIAARLLGHYGEIRSTALNHAYITYNGSVPLWHHWVIFGAGGVSVFLLFTVLVWKNIDNEHRIIYVMSAVSNLIYAFFEALFPSTFWELGSILGIFIGLIYFMYLLLIKRVEVTL